MIFKINTGHVKTYPLAKPPASLPPCSDVVSQKHGECIPFPMGSWAHGHEIFQWDLLAVIRIALYVHEKLITTSRVVVPMT